MERLATALSSKVNALIILNQEEGLIIVVHQPVSSLPHISTYSLKNFDQVNEADLDVDFEPTTLATRRDWLSLTGEGHGTDHVAVLALSNPGVVEVLDPKRVPVIEAKWHPLTEDTLVVLYADFYLRMYDVTWKSSPRLEINLAESLSYENIPVSFAFPEDTDDATFYRFACYVLLKDGSIYAFNPMLPDSFFVSQNFSVLIRESRLRHLVAIEPRINDWLLSLQENAVQVEASGFKFGVTEEMREMFRPVAIGPLRKAGIGEYSHLICISSSQPLVLFAMRISGVIDVLVSFADCIPKFYPDRYEDIILELDPIQPSEPRSRVEFQKQDLHPMNDSSWLYILDEKLYELDLHWISELRNKFETRELQSVHNLGCDPILLYETGSITSAVFIQHRLHDKFFVVATETGVELRELNSVQRVLGSVVEVKDISPSDGPQESFKPKAPGLLTVSSPPQVNFEEVTEQPQYISQLAKVVDQLMETRVIPITKRVAFLTSLMTELATQRTQDEESLKSCSDSTLPRFTEMLQTMKSNLEVASQNCGKLRDNIEIIIQKMNRIYTPLSEEEIDIKNRIKRLHTLTEQLKVEAQARKGDRGRVTDLLEIKKVALRFPLGTKVHEILARLNHVGVKIEEAEKSVSKLLNTG